MRFNSHQSEEIHQFVANEAGVKAEENGQEHTGTKSIQELGLGQEDKSQYCQRGYTELGSCKEQRTPRHHNVHDRIDLNHAAVK